MTQNRDAATEERTGGIRLADPGWLAGLVGGGEDTLIRSTLAYADRQGYVRYTSTLEEAWRASIRGLSAAVIDILEASPRVPELTPHGPPAGDPGVAFAVGEARRHRSRGVSLALFLGLFKYYRQGYVDLVERAADGPADRAPYRLFIERCFDRIEIGVSSEWVEEGESERLTSLREENLRVINEKNKYLTIFESLNEPVVLVDEDGFVANLNHAAARLLEGVDRPGSFYYGGREPAWIDPAMAGLLSAHSGPGAVVEVELGTALGRRWFEVRVEAMLDVSRKFAGTVFIFADVTERKRAAATLEEEVARRTADLSQSNRKLSQLVDELRRSAEDLERFAFVASHDLQEPLRTVVGFTQLLARRHADPADAEEAECVAFIVGGAKRLSAMINDLLVYARINARGRGLAPVDAGAALSAALDRLGPALAAAGARVDRQALPMVTADPDQLAEVFVQLLDNAIKFRRDGVAPMVAVAADRAGERWRFSVTDNGIGVAPEHRDEVFQAFRRLHAHHEVPGTGIGLAVAKRIVERHGGRIWVEGAPGGGSRFLFELAGA